MDKPTVIVGASDKAHRFANKALKKLRAYGHSVIPVHPRLKEIDGHPVAPAIDAVTSEVHTVTMYVGPERSTEMASAIIALRPKRVVFNPGSESEVLMRELRAAGIEVIAGCTLVMLDSKTY